MRIVLASFLVLVTADITLAAEAVTYKGSLGGRPVIVELISPDDDGGFVGRYAYMAKGIDIPLHGMEADGRLTIEEEQPCTPELCMKDGEAAEVAPIGAEWTLKQKAHGTRLAGIWRDKHGGKSLAITLVRVAARQLADDRTTDFETLDPTNVLWARSPEFVEPKDLPYDFLKMDYPLQLGKVTALGDGSYRLDKDSRTDLSYPTLVSLKGQNMAAANRYLAQQRLQWELAGFDCLSHAYLGYGWTENTNGTSNGYDGNDVAELTLLTPRLIGVEEDGSYSCGGAHPENFTRAVFGDVKTGKPLTPETLLKGWVARNADGVVVDPALVDDKSSLIWGPSDELVKLVNGKREKFDVETETECSIDDLVRSNLGVDFTSDELVFTLKVLPHAIFACTNVLLAIPLKDARPLLTDAGARYFEALDR